MPNERPTDEPVVTSLDGADIINAVDVSDTTDNAAGSDVQITIANLAATLGTELAGTFDASGSAATAQTAAEATAAAALAAQDLGDHADVTITSPSSGQVLKYDGSAWVNDTDATGTGGVDTSGTPVANDFARFTDADTIEGRSAAETLADIGAEAAGTAASAVAAHEAIATDVHDASAISIDPTGFKVIGATDVQTLAAVSDIAALNARSTGVRFGGDLSDLGAGVVRITAGAGGILDNTDPSDPDYTAVTWSQTDLDLSATDDVYFVYVNAAGTVTSTTTEPSHGEYRTGIYLWRVSIRSGAVSGTTSIVQPTQQSGPQIRDLWMALGPIKRGMTLAAASTDLTVAVGAGEVYLPGSNFYTDATNPHEIDIAAVSPVTFRHVTQDGTQTADRTTLDVGNYDVSNTVTAVPGATSRATIMEWRLFPGSSNHRIFYGQEWYTTVAEAYQALSDGLYTATVPTSYDNSIVLGWVIVQKGATNLADGTQLFVTANRFGGVGGAISSAGANALLASNNLSDLADAATARTNLGVEIGADVQAWSAVLDATTASFTTADESKLDGIEAGADVTDTANVTAAGALMDSEVDADIKTLALPANTTISTFGATLVDDADAATARATLGADITSSSDAADLAKITAVTRTGTTDTIADSDHLVTLIYSNASAVAVTIPTGLTVGGKFFLNSTGAGGLTLTTTGNTLLGAAPSTGIAQDEGLYVEVTASNTLLVRGGTV